MTTPSEIVTFRCAGSDVQVPDGTLATMVGSDEYGVCPGCHEFVPLDYLSYEDVQRFREHLRTAEVVLD